MNEAIKTAIAGKTPDADGEIRADCPSPKCEGGQRDTLGVNVQTGAFHCFRCDVRGNIKHNGTDNKPLAQFLHDQARPVNTHPYAEKKQIQPNEIRQDVHGNWIVPFMDQAGSLKTVQFIKPDGSKFFLSKAKNNGVGFKGSAYIIEGSKDIIIWCEGIATGWSIYLATGATVICCGSKDNLDPVMAWSVGRYPDSKKTLAGDNDKSGDGQRVGAAAARKYKVLFACPGTNGDFNDMAIEAGLEAVKTVLDNAKVPEPVQEPDVRIPSGITAADLMKKEFPEPKWAVPGLIPEGLNILGGKPKQGKSIAALNLGIAIASGGVVFSQIRVEQGSVIYLALEDPQRRLKARLGEMLCFGQAPKDLHLYNEWPRMGEGGAAALDALIRKTPNTRLVIIDTLQKFRPPGRANGNFYAEDYDVIAKLKRIADNHEVAFLIIHHLRKMEASDPFDMFFGTLGLTGAADGLMVMARNSGGQMIFALRGRDIEEQALVLEFEPRMLSWVLKGKADEVKNTTERQKLFDALKESKQPVSPKDLESITGLRGNYIRKTLPTFLQKGSIQRVGRGTYIYIRNNGNNGNKEHNGNNGNNHDSPGIIHELFPQHTAGNNDREQLKPSIDKGFDGIVPNVPIVPPDTGNNQGGDDVEFF